MASIGIVLLGGVFGFLLAALWYSSFLFGKQWRKVVKLKSDAKPTLQTLVMAFVSSCFISFVLSYLVVYTGAISFFDGAYIGFICWLGFIAPVLFMPVLWEDKQVHWFWIHALYYLVLMLVLGGFLVIL